MKNLLTALLEGYFKQNQVKNLKCMNNSEFSEFCQMFAVYCADHLITEIDKLRNIDEMYKIQEKIMQDNGWICAKLKSTEHKIVETNKLANKVCCENNKKLCNEQEKNVKKNIEKHVSITNHDQKQKPNVLALTPEQCKKTSNRGKARKNISLKLYSNVNDVPHIQGNDVFAVYLRKNGVHSNVYYGSISLSMKRSTALNELRTVYSRTLGVDYMSVSACKASNECKLRKKSSKKISFK